MRLRAIDDPAKHHDRPAAESHVPEIDGPGDVTRGPWRTSGLMLRNIRAFPVVRICLPKFGYHRQIIFRMHLEEFA